MAPDNVQGSRIQFSGRVRGFLLPVYTWRSGQTCVFFCAIPLAAQPHVLFLQPNGWVGDVSDFRRDRLLKFRPR